MSTEDPEVLRPERAPEPTSLSAAAMDSMFAAIASETVDTPSGPLERLRELSTPRRVALLLAVQIAVSVAAVGWQTPRADLVSIALAIGVVSLLSLAVGAVSLRSAGAASGGASRLSPWMVVAPLLLAVPAVWPGVQMPFWDAIPMHQRCLAWSSIVGVAAFAPFVVLDRHGLLRRWSVYAAAGSAGTFAFVVQMAVCPLATFEHRILTHGTTGVTLAVVLTVFLWIRSTLKSSAT